MARLLLALLVLPLFPVGTSAADDARFAYLEQEIRNLQRQVQVLTRQLDEIRNRPARPETQRSRAMPPKSGAVAGDDLPRWVEASLWRNLRPGMSELDVIGALGPPTSMRDDGDSRVLLYAMEIGASGFLGGSVKLRERAVVEIVQPALQ
jgi:hypothetical protein